jgi:hypothetical protein
VKASEEFLAGSTGPARTSSREPTSPGSGSGLDSSARDPSGTHADEAGDRAASASSDGLVDIVFRFVQEVIGSADSLIEVYADRIRLSVRRTMVQAVIGAGAAICAAVWLGAASLAILRGVCGGLTALFDGRAWLGELTGGLLALALTAGAAALYLRLSSRRELARLKAKYERIRNENSQSHETATPAGDG